MLQLLDLRDQLLLLEVVLVVDFCQSLIQHFFVLFLSLDGWLLLLLLRGGGLRALAVAGRAASQLKLFDLCLVQLFIKLAFL